MLCFLGEEEEVDDKNRKSHESVAWQFFGMLSFCSVKAVFMRRSRLQVIVGLVTDLRA